MKQSSVWLLIGVGATAVLAMVVCCGLGTSIYNTRSASQAFKSSGKHKAVAKSSVDLEKLTKAFETYVTPETKDINGFEKVVNDKSKGIYKGKDPVKVTMDTKGAVLGYVDKDNTPGYSKSQDTLVFTMQAEKDKKRIVAYDRHQNYYGHRSYRPGFFTGLLIGNMLTRQHGHYGYHWRPPVSARWRTAGYYNRVNNTYRRSSYRRSGSSYRRSGSSYRSYRSTTPSYRRSGSSYRSGSSFRSSRSGSSYRSSGSRSGYRSGGYRSGKN